MVIWFVNTIYMCLIHTSWEISVVVWCKCLQMILFCYTVPKLERGLCPPCVCKLVVFFTLAIDGSVLVVAWKHTCAHMHTHTYTHTPQMVTWQGCGRHSTQQVYPKTNHWGHSLQTYIKLHAKQSVYTRIYYNFFSFSLSPQTSIAPHSMVLNQQQTMVCTLTP